MLNTARTEWLKEKRSANRKLIAFTPPVFICFSLFASLLMANPPAGKSYLITVAYNWYPMLILPAVLALLSANMVHREKPVHRQQFAAKGLSAGKMTVAKLVVLWVNYAVILFFSLLLLAAAEGVLLGHAVPWRALLVATSLLFVANAFVFPFSVWLSSYVGTVGVVFINFFLFAFGAVVAVTPYWFLYPWCYGVVLMAPVLGIHPNGTFLLPDHPMNNAALIPLGGAASVMACLVMLILLFAWRRKAQR